MLGTFIAQSYGITYTCVMKRTWFVVNITYHYEYLIIFTSIGHYLNKIINVIILIIIIWLKPPLCVVSSWVIRVYTILVWSTISGSSNLDICFYYCLILTLILHLKVLFIITINIINIITTTTTTITIIVIISIIIVVVVVVDLVVVLLLFIIYIVNLLVVRPRSCRVIYYFDTPALGRGHQSFGRVKFLVPLPGR